MNSFRDLNIQDEATAFTGAKVGIDVILNKEIIIHDYLIKESRYKEKGNGKCLYLQIELNGEKRVLFTGSGRLMQTIEKIDKSKLPIKTTIIKEFNSLKFT